ncbi:hypothetical protein ABID52_002353 [Fictibacillus halophilus]|uniref:Transposase n=1 Tax=Fictibacillus halophilus TaxID=1610490 RepID=A0ABV2LJL6_9BACL
MAHHKLPGKRVPETEINHYQVQLMENSLI